MNEDAICEECSVPIDPEEVMRCAGCGADGLCVECWTFRHERCREMEGE